MENTYIKLYRGLLDWEWFSDSKMLQLFIYLLIRANYIDSKFKGYEVKRGQLIIGRKQVAKTLCMSEQSVRTCFSNLVLTNEITIKTTNKFSLVTIVKYEDYQSFDKKVTIKVTNKQPANQPTTNQQLTTIEERKEEEEVYRSFAHLKLSLSDFQKLNIIYTKKQIDDILDSIENYKKNTGYTSLYLTSVKWLKKEYPNIVEKEKCPYDVNQIRLARTQRDSGGGIPSWFDLKYKEVLND